MYTFLDMKNFFRNLQIFLSQKETLGEFFKEKWENSIKNIQNKEEIFLHSVIAESFCGECALICRSKNGAAKKLNMFLRWMVRENSPVDLGLWKLRLNTRLNEIMPYYNKLYKSELLEFNPLYTANLQRKKKSNLNSNRKANENIEGENNTNKIANNNVNVNSKESSNVKNEEKENITNVNDKSDLYSDTPQGSLSGVENKTYLTNARKTNENTNNTKNNTNNTTITNSSESSNKESITDETTGIYKRAKGNTDSLLSTEEYIEEIMGYEGTNGSELLQKFRDTFLNIDVMVINELEDLFFQLW